MSIRVSRKHGVNPSLEICNRCGKETGTIILPGSVTKYKCSVCKSEFYGHCAQVCIECKSSSIKLWEQDVPMPRHCRTGAICGGCKKEIERNEEVVKEGGIIFMCEDCKAEGVIKHSSPICQAVREKLGVPPPKPCGIKFTKKNCPRCGPNPVA